MKILKNIGQLGLAIILLTLAWPPFKLGFLVYIGFVPLLFYVDSFSNLSNLKRYFLTFLGFLFVLFLFPFVCSYNGWGDYNNNIFMVILMCFLPMSFVVSFFPLFRNKNLGFLFLIFSWGVMDILQMNWEFNSPLLMLGYSMSYYPSLIQHYAIWGALGGALHILAINILIYNLILKVRDRSPFKAQIVGLTVLFVPSIISLITFHIPNKSGKKTSIAMVLAHFEHFTEKYAKNPLDLIHNYNLLLKEKNVEDAEILVLPESTIVEGGWIENLNNPNIPNPMDSLCKGKSVLFGSHMFSIHNKKS